MAGKPSPKTVSTKIDQIAKLAKQMPGTALTSLSHHIDVDWLREAHRRTRKDGAPGVDRQTADEYASKLEENLSSLLDRAKSGDRYRAPPVRRVHIPKGDGSKTRPIGIPTFEDKILQRAVVMALEAVYEQDFLDCSFGFRPGRSAHQALHAVWSQLTEMKGGWVLEADIEAFFDSVDHGLLQQMLRRRVRDGVLLRLVGKWLNAGVMEEGCVYHPDAGTPQGGVITPPTQVQTSNGAAAFPERRCELEHPTNAGDRDDRGDAEWILGQFLDSFGPALQGRVPDASVAAHSGRVCAIPALDAASAQRV